MEPSKNDGKNAKEESKSNSKRKSGFVDPSDDLMETKDKKATNAKKESEEM